PRSGPRRRDSAELPVRRRSDRSARGLPARRPRRYQLDRGCSCAQNARFPDCRAPQSNRRRRDRPPAEPPARARARRYREPELSSREQVKERIGLARTRRAREVISLTLTGIAPRIRACRDSLAHLHQLPPAKGVLVAWLK